MVFLKSFLTPKFPLSLIGGEMYFLKKWVDSERVRELVVEDENKGNT